jgi:hypothetical protein
MVYFGDGLNTKTFFNLGEKMTEDTNLENIDSPTEVSVIEAETVFLIVKEKNGLFRAITDISTKISAERSASLIDIRNACRDIASSIQTHETAQVVVALLNKQEPSN